MRSNGQLAATSEQPTCGGNQRPRLVAAAGFIDIGNSVVVAPMVEEQCISRAVRLMPMLQHARNAKAALEPTPAGTHVAMPCGPIALEDILIHLLSHLEPAELGDSQPGRLYCLRRGSRASSVHAACGCKWQERWA